MGDTTKLILAPLSSGQTLPTDLSLDILDPKGALIATVAASVGADGAYRTQGWTVPHRSLPGTWTVEAASGVDTALRAIIGRFQVAESTSERLLATYGVWVDPPAFRGIVTDLVAEKGDWRDGMIRIGGTSPGQHILPEEWIEIHWRRGPFPLSGPQAARDFMLKEIGDFGFTPVRELGAFEAFPFKQWPAWKATARGQFHYVDSQWIVFYAPETDHTYAIGTTVVLPPASVNAHALLRESFELHAEVHPAGAAPDPLPHLLPAPDLLGPELGATFEGTRDPIRLRWSPVKPLAPDEYYRVTIDYNYLEANPTIRLDTRETGIEVPHALYREPNCRVFNWQVTLMKGDGSGEAVAAPAIALSYRSFYRYFLWTYPERETQPFPPLCPNAQY